MLTHSIDNGIDWPFRYMPVFGWSEIYPDYQERMRHMSIDAIHWATMIDARS